MFWKQTLQRIQENVRTRTSFAVPKKITELELSSICQTAIWIQIEKLKNSPWRLNISRHHIIFTLNTFSKVAFVLVDVKQPVITYYVFVNESAAVIQPFKFSQWRK